MVTIALWVCITKVRRWATGYPKELCGAPNNGQYGNKWDSWENVIILNQLFKLYTHQNVFWQNSQIWSQQIWAIFQQMRDWRKDIFFCIVLLDFSFDTSCTSVMHSANGIIGKAAQSANSGHSEQHCIAVASSPQSWLVYLHKAKVGHYQVKEAKEV